MLAFILGMFVGCFLGFLILGVLAMAAKVSQCSDCLLYQQFVQNREEAHASNREEVEARRRGQAVEGHFPSWKN